MADLAPLRELYAWMREEGILYARAGELELRLEARPLTPAALPESTPAESSEAAARRDLEELLYSSGVDPAPFLSAARVA